MTFTRILSAILGPSVDRMPAYRRDPATVVFEQRGTGVYMHTAICLLLRRDLTHPLTFRWDYDYGGWFWVRGHRG